MIGRKKKRGRLHFAASEGMSEGNVSIRIVASMSGFAEAANRLGKAFREMSAVLANSLQPALRDALGKLRREFRTNTGPWYRRWYWRAAYATADTFPDWVSVE